MGSFEALALAAWIAAAGVSLIAFRAAANNLHRSPWLRRMGRRFHRQKMAALEKSPLSHYKRWVENGALARSFLFIAAGILLKSAVSGLLGLVVIFYLPFGVAVIPAMAAEHGVRPGLREWVARVTLLQAGSHLLAASLGFAACWLWLSDGTGPGATLAASPVFSASMVMASVLTGLAAAWVETEGHVRRHFLD